VLSVGVSSSCIFPRVVERRRLSCTADSTIHAYRALFSIFDEPYDHLKFSELVGGPNGKWIGRRYRGNPQGGGAYGENARTQNAPRKSNRGLRVYGYRTRDSLRSPLVAFSLTTVVCNSGVCVHSLHLPYCYLILTVEPALTVELALRKVLSDALATAFRLVLVRVYAGAPVNVLAPSPTIPIRIASGLVRA
jgi:hypothetical protein